jgi:hypothetical protein
VVVCDAPERREGADEGASAEVDCLVGGERHDGRRAPRRIGGGGGGGGRSIRER